MEKENVMIKEDRISQLPECIIESILSLFKSSKERVQMSVLSKYWYALTASYPVMDFDLYNFIEGMYGTRYYDDGSNIFHEYIERSVSRFCCQQKVKNVHKFKLFTKLKDDTEVGVINKCLGLILRKGVKVLDISIRLDEPLSVYRLPDIPSSSISLLTSLTLFNCELPSSLMVVDVAKFMSLKVLSLNYIRVHPHMIEHLATSCPILEELIAEYCGFNKFCIYGLQKLKKVRFYDKVIVERINIEAPNLCECKLSAACGKGTGATSLNLSSCKALKTLHLTGSLFPTSKGLSEFLFNCSILENLFLCLINRCKNLKVSSPSLRKLVLYSESDLDDIEIDTPNLLFFGFSNEYSPCKMDIGQMKISDSELQTRMECDINSSIDTLWFQKLRRFLDKTNRFKVLKLQTSHIWKLSVDFKQLKASQLPPYDLEHVELELETSKGCSSVMDGVLWCCRPQSLSATFMGYKEKRYDEFISEKLLQYEDQSHTNIRIESYFPSKDTVCLPRFQQRHTLTFYKEKVVQEYGNNGTLKGMRLLRLHDALT